MWVVSKQNVYLFINEINFMSFKWYAALCYQSKEWIIRMFLFGRFNKPADINTKYR